jgi:hypothetical protein
MAMIEDRAMPPAGCFYGLNQVREDHSKFGTSDIDTGKLIKGIEVSRLEVMLLLVNGNVMKNVQHFA